MPNAAGESETAPPVRWQVPFVSIWASQAFSLLGSWLVQFALIWWLTERTGSATVLAMATLVGLLPQILVLPLAGALVDRWDRRRLMIVADSLTALISLWLAYLFVVGAARPWHVLVAMMSRAVAGAFHWPAMQASTTLMVPKAQLSRVAGLNQTLNGAMNIVAPPLGALLLTLMPVQGVLLIDVGTAVPAVAALMLIAIPSPRRTAVELSGGRDSLWHDLQGGLRYVWHWPGLRAVMLMAAAINFLANPAFSMLPILVTKHFGGGVVQLGLLNSVWGVGVVVGGACLSTWGGSRRRVVTSLCGLAGMGLGFLVLGVTPASAFGLALAGLWLAGFMEPMVDGPLFATVQATVSPDMQGRVLSLLISVAKITSPVSLAVAGPVADALGVRVWYLAAGLLCLIIAVGAFFVPDVMRIEEQVHGPAS